MAKIKTPKRVGDLPQPYHTRALELAAAENDLGCAIIGTAFLDLSLRRLLEHHMLQDSGLMTSLFDSRGALQDFSSRINIAYAFQFIGPAAFDDLHIMRQIRNAFAHSADEIGFGRQDVALMCERLAFPASVHVKDQPDPSTPRDRFLRATSLIGEGLFEATHPVLSKSRFIHLGRSSAIRP